MFRKMGVFRLNPQGLDQDELELYLIDHGLDEMGESTGELQGISGTMTITVGADGSHSYEFDYKIEA